MFADKSLKSNEGAKKVDTGNKTLQQKAHSKKLIQRVMMAPNTLLTGDVAQLKRMFGNQGLVSLLNTEPIQREAKPEEEEEPLQMKQEDSLNNMPLQREAKPEEEEEPLQMKEEEEEPLQMKTENLLNTKALQREAKPEEEEEPLQMKKENNTGMPDQLKAGVESLSGIDMSDVRVHYNSDKPAEVGALAYTQGTDLQVASGQEKHLAHEAWHVVQQAQGRVQPTTQLKDVAVNDDPGLENEADVMGERALSIPPNGE
jgi:hypothetical protein